MTSTSAVQTSTSERASVSISVSDSLVPAAPQAKRQTIFARARALSPAQRAQKKATRSAQDLIQAILGTSTQQPKQIKQLRSDLLSPKRAARIIEELKTSPLTAEQQPARALCVNDCNPTTYERLQSGTNAISNLVSLLPTPASVAASAVEISGASDALANLSASLVEHDTPIPLDRMTFFLYYWGYEIAIPKACMKNLQSAHSASSTLFTFLQVVSAAGAPEITPFIRYLSSYVDMEMQSIKAQDKGLGVCLAATWLVPIAVIPRPWDFPLDAKT